MKKLQTGTLLLIPAVICLLLTGCIETSQLNRRAIVQAVGVDLEEDGTLTLTFQVFAPAVEGSGGISATADNARVIQSRGATIADAVQNAALLQGKELFMGHNRVILIGKRLAQEDAEPILRYFEGDPTSRQNVCVALAEDRAEKILTAKVNQGILPAEILEKLLKNGEESGLVVHTELYQFLKALESGWEAPLMPIMAAAEPKESEGLELVSTLSVTGTGVFHGGKLAGTMGLESSRGILWARGEVDRTVVVVPSAGGGASSLRLSEVRASLKPERSGEGLRFRLRLEGKASPEESGGADPKELLRAGEAAIRRECGTAFSLGQRYEADLLGLGGLVWQRDAERWKGLRETWPDPLADAELVVDVRLHEAGEK